MTDDELMGLAIEEAKAAIEHGDRAVGAVVVCDGEVIARRHNEQAHTGDPTARAEVLAIRDAAEAVGVTNLAGSTIVVTVEPSVLAAGAILAAELGRVVFGTVDMGAGATGSLYHVGSDPRLGHEFTTTPNVRAAECAALLVDDPNRR
ncbi:MAG: nucleoside deaminase [Actinomycetota bacterium]